MSLKDNLVLGLDENGNLNQEYADLSFLTENLDSVNINFDGTPKTSKRPKKLKCKPGFKQQGAVCKPTKQKKHNPLLTTAIAAAGVIAASKGMTVVAKSTKLQQSHEEFDDLGQFIDDKKQVFQKSLKQITNPSDSLESKVYRNRQLYLAEATLQDLSKGKIPSAKKPKSWSNPNIGAGDRLALLTLARGRRREELSRQLTKYRKAPASPEEMAALEFYSTPRGVAHINNTLRGDDRRLKTYLKTTNDDYNLRTAKRNALIEAKLAASALTKMPKHQGKVYRGVEFDNKIISQYTPGKIVSDPGFASTTRNPLKKFGGNKMVINSKNGRYISGHINRYQEEVVFLPETKFRVNKVEKSQIEKKEYTVLFLDEI